MVYIQRNNNELKYIMLWHGKNIQLSNTKGIFTNAHFCGTGL